jgi:CheY-like chemotaxis protein
VLYSITSKKRTVVKSRRKTNAALALSSILVVEQDRVVCELQRHFLERAGLVVEFTSDGESALQTAQLHQPSLIVTEILIPKIDGLALCRRLKADPSTMHIPVIVFSILNAGARAAEAGAEAFLRKPLVEISFIAAIQSLLPPRSSATLEQHKWLSQ